MNLYFAYGANLNSEVFAQRCPNARIISCSKLPGYKLVFNKKDKSRFDLGFANVVPTKNDYIEGVLYKIEKDNLSRLDRYEGYPDQYNREKVEVITNDGKSLAWIYKAKKTADGLLPTKKCIQNITNCNLLSTDYRKKIGKVHDFLQWYDRSKQQEDPFHKFEDLWKSFNGYNNTVFKPIARNTHPGIISENLIINALKESKDLLDMWDILLKNQNFLEALKVFRKTIHKKDGCYIIRMDNEDKVRYDDEANFQQFISVIYQIRCNTLHGEKTPYEPNDQKIVKATYDVLLELLSRVFEPFL